MADLQAASLTFSILAFLTSAIGILLVYFPGIRDTFTSVFDRTSTGSFSGILSLLGAFSPDIALFSGFISDIMNGSFRFSVTSLVGIIAVILHGIVGGFFFGFAKSASISSIIPTLTEVIGVGEDVLPVVGGDVTSTPKPAEEVPKATAASKPAVSAAPTATTFGSGPESVSTLELPPGASSSSVKSGHTENTRKTPPVLRTLKNNLRRLGPMIPGTRPQRPAAAASRDRTSKLAASSRRNEYPGDSASVSGSSAARKTPKKGRGRDELESQSGGARSAVLSNFNPCAIRGLGFLDVKGSPMGMAALAAIFMVYLLDMTTKKSPATIGGYLAFSFVVFGLNLFAYSELECVADTSYVGLLKAISLPTAIGLVTGGIAYGVMKANYKSFLPLDPEGFQPGAPGNQPQCGKPSDNEFVCDAYKDGKRISTAVVS